MKLFTVAIVLLVVCALVCQCAKYDGIKNLQGMCVYMTMKGMRNAE